MGTKWLILPTSQPARPIRGQHVSTQGGPTGAGMCAYMCIVLTPLPIIAKYSEITRPLKKKILLDPFSFFLYTCRRSVILALDLDQIPLDETCGT